VFLGATSTFKADSDLAKYEKARKLKDLIVDIRKNYEAVRGPVELHEWRYVHHVCVSY
jgi:hypothetical protein